MLNNSLHLTNINSPVRQVKAKVELYEGSTLVKTFAYTDALKSFSVERIGESKFFGFGICHKINIHLIDSRRELNITTDNSFKVYFGAGENYIKSLPTFHISEVHRDENTNELSITAYDVLYRASERTVSELVLKVPYTIGNFVSAATALVNGGKATNRISKNEFNYLVYDGKSANGLTAKLNGNGSITVTGTPTADYANLSVSIIDLTDDLEDSQIYTISQSAPDYIYLQIDAVPLDGSATIRYVSSNSTTKTSASFIVNKSKYIYRIRIQSGLMSNVGSNINTTLFFQLEKGSVATAWQPYLPISDTVYPSGANFEGSESIREALNMVAEATQTIYYVDSNDYITFKRLDMGGKADLTIDKSKYISLDSKTNRRLAKIVHVTELGDNVSAELAVSGTTQYVRDNAFWDLRDDIGTIVNNALAAIGGLTINQFNCEWRGNYLLEPGDKIDLVTKDGGTVTSYVLNDTINYDGSFAQTTEWEFADNEEETAENPSSLGDALKQTFAKVDKANKQIELMASDIQANSSEISSLMMNVDSINASVQQTEKNVNETFGDIGDEIAELTKRVDATMTSEDITFLIQQEISVINPEVDKVITSTGFRFDADGLTVSKSNSAMTTQITEDGMAVYRDGEEALVADNEGVKAANLHATTYLIVGTYSRFEDYGDRTCCFWIG